MAVAEGFDDCGQEGRVAVEHGIGAELAGAKGVDLPVRKTVYDILFVEFLSRGCLTYLSVLARDHEGFFGRGQVVGVGGVVGEDEPGGDAEDEGWEPFDYHDPAPAA